MHAAHINHCYEAHFLNELTNIINEFVFVSYVFWFHST